MEKHYIGGYYLIKFRPKFYGLDIAKILNTCSSCINLSVFHFWGIDWVKYNLEYKHKLTDEKKEAIQKWINIRSETNVFPNLNSAIEFKGLFFNNRDDLKIYGLSFPETDADLLICDYAEGQNIHNIPLFGDFGLRKNLMKKTEDKDNENEEVLGYDFIGVECDGSFHSFYCHGLQNTLSNKFSLRLNQHGLFEKPETPSQIRDYLTDPVTRVAEPVPWYIVKVKRLKNASS